MEVMTAGPNRLGLYTESMQRLIVTPSRALAHRAVAGVELGHPPMATAMVFMLEVQVHVPYLIYLWAHRVVADVELGQPAVVPQCPADGQGALLSDVVPRQVQVLGCASNGSNGRRLA